MIYLYILVPLGTLLLGAALGYLLGRYQTALLDKIRTLENRPEVVKPTDPTVIMGAYQPPEEVSTSPDGRSVGLVETKTPERVEWEAKQAIEKEGRGY